MILYHGTDSKNLDSILKNGLLPRKETGVQVHSGDFASRDDFTYLTSYNPAAHAYTLDENSPVIFQVDIPESELYPDEDFLERLEYMKTGVVGKPAAIDISQSKDLWKASLEMFGSVAIRRVPVESIMKHIVLNPADFEYHCGLGAQGNMGLKRDELHFEANAALYMRRLKLLFAEGWEEVKEDILKDLPSVVLGMTPVKWVKAFGLEMGVLAELPGKVPLYILDAWRENVASAVFDSRLSKFAQVDQRYTS